MNYILICDNIIYENWSYLNFTLLDGVKWFIYDIKFKEFSNCDFKGRVYLFAKIFKQFVYNKTKLFLKKNYPLFLVTTIFNSSGETISTFQVMRSPSDNSRILAISLGMLDLSVIDFELALCTLVTAFNIIISPIICLVTNILDSSIIKIYLKFIYIVYTVTKI